MANPQTEDGYTEIANELLEAIIKTPMSDYEHRVFWLIVRKTYGYKKKSDWISQKQLVEYTGILKQHISRTIKKLYEKNMIIKKGRKLAIQKDYEQWKLPKQVTKISNQNKLQTKESNLNRLQKLPEKVTNKDTKVTQIGYESNLNRGTQNKTIQKKYIYTKVPYEQIINLYHSICISLPKVLEVTDKRKLQMGAVFKKYGIDKIKTVFSLAEESDFLTGRNGSWKCNFDWIMNSNNFIKILEGNYKNKAGKKNEEYYKKPKFV